MSDQQDDTDWDLLARSNTTIAWMIKHNIPLTRQDYLESSHLFDGPPKEADEASPPAPFRKEG